MHSSPVLVGPLISIMIVMIVTSTITNNTC